MKATDNIALRTIGDENSTRIDTIPTKISKREMPNLHSATSNGVIENGNDSLSNSISSVSSELTEEKKVNELTLVSSTHSQSSDQNSSRISHQLNQRLTPVESSASTTADIESAQKFRQVELTNVTDEDDDNGQAQIRDLQPINRILSDHDTMVSSYTTGGDNDIIEIHEFSLADIDAYLDIYFETLDNRLRHFIGGDEQLQRFRSAMKTRISTDANSREYQNVLLGKISGEVVASVTLSFPGETATVADNDVLPQSNSCLISIRRWLVRAANYVPINMEECYIEMIGVKSAYRNHGIGAAMLECAEHFARQAGALQLTVHTHGEQLRNYFQRFGFGIDNTDYSAYSKWLVERQSITKLSKLIPPDNGNNNYPMDNTSSYINESSIGSQGE